MLISEPETVYDAVKPLVYFNCFVGMGAFRIPNLSGTIYFSMKLQTVIFTVSNLIMTYVTFNAINQVLDSDNISPMALTMYKILFAANSSITAIAPLLLFLRRKVLKNCLQQIAILNDTFESVIGVRNEYKKQYIRHFYHMSAIVLVMFAVGICDTVVNLNVELKMNVRSVLTFCSVAQTLHHPILVMLVLDVNFCTSVGYLEKKFRDLNESLSELTGKPPTSHPGKRLFVISQNVRKTATAIKVKNTIADRLITDWHYSLREIRKAHLGLCKLARSINFAFGVQNLLSTGISFVMITGLLYTIYSAFSWHNFSDSKLREVISTTTWTGIYAFKIWLVNHSCWSVSSEAEKTGEVIYDLLNSMMDTKLQQEIHEFGVQMLQNPVRFTACGFFTLDYTFIQGVIGSITTYLIILIQMSNVSETPTSDTALTCNSTEI